MVKRLGSYHDIKGPHGLLLAVILTAVKDAKRSKKHRDDALAFFNGPAYRTYLELLGLPTDWLPEGIDRKMVSS